jgi:D-alanine-D-alanine ligase
METIAVIFGGRSAEHDISIITAIASIIKPLELTGKYRVEAVYIAKNGTWYWDDQLKDIELYSSGKIQHFIDHTKPVSLCFKDGLTLVKYNALGGHRQKKIDLVFPSMHGTYGEDGDLMGLLELTGVPYAGCGVSASAIAMNKVLSKQLAAANGIPVAQYLSFSSDNIKYELLPIVESIEKELHYPLFVKPAHLGSSIGISRVVNAKELTNGLEVAAHYDDTVLVEEAIQNLLRCRSSATKSLSRPCWNNRCIKPINSLILIPNTCAVARKASRRAVPRARRATAKYRLTYRRVYMIRPKRPAWQFTGLWAAAALPGWTC